MSVEAQGSGWGPVAKRTAGAGADRLPDDRLLVSQASRAAAGEPAPRPDQLSLFRLPRDRVTQLRELPGVSFEDIFNR